MSPPEASALAGMRPIPRDEVGPVFPAPWAARAFALAVALNERGVFTWNEWAEALGAALAVQGEQDGSDPEAYWRAWLGALETIVEQERVAAAADLLALRGGWRHAADATPHGEPIELRR